MVELTLKPNEFVLVSEDKDQAVIASSSDSSMLLKTAKENVIDLSCEKLNDLGENGAMNDIKDEKDIDKMMMSQLLKFWKFTMRHQKLTKMSKLSIMKISHRSMMEKRMKERKQITTV